MRVITWLQLGVRVAYILTDLNKLHRKPSRLSISLPVRPIHVSASPRISITLHKESHPLHPLGKRHNANLP